MFGNALILSRFPSGRWGFNGRVPAQLALCRKDGAPMTPDDYRRAAEANAPSLLGYTTRAWESRGAAESAAAEAGATITQVCP